MRTVGLGLTLLLAAGPAAAASRDLLYGPAPAWVTPAPAQTTAATPSGAPVRVMYMDQQARLSAEGTETYLAYRMKVLTPQALGLGNISAQWNPSSDDMTVHVLRIIRGSQSIDVLATGKFQVIQRENNFENSVLDGELTAGLQVPGLQLGDELEFAATIRRRDPNLGDGATGFLQLPIPGQPGSYRVRLTWPEGRKVTWAASKDMGSIASTLAGGQRELVVELDDPRSSVLTDGSPGRSNVRRLIEYSTFSSWAELSNLMAPLYDKASALPANSPVRAEAAKIAQQTADPTARAEAALRLVQDQIRYVYVGLDGGNYRPASADETWERRFGDCKAKSTLLIALLRELGVKAELMLVNLNGGDGTNERLPSPALFNHLLVRAKLGSGSFWLDGTRQGDRTLTSVPPPPFRWALPLVAGETAQLEAVPATFSTAPVHIMVLDQDASAGFDAPAKIKAQEVVRGDKAFAMQTGLAAGSSEDVDRTLKSYWREALEEFTPASVSWKYDADQKVLVLTTAGEGKLDWDGDEKDGRNLSISGAGFTPSEKLRRPSEQDQSAPWLVESQGFRCWVTSIKLPPADSRWGWNYRAAVVNRRLGGIIYWRAAGLDEGVMRTVMSTQPYQLELSAAEAKDFNDGMRNFDNNISMVFQVRGKSKPSTGPGLTALARFDWTSPVGPCDPPPVLPTPAQPK